jgi:hypothetical protein
MTVVGIVSPGAMGSAVGRALREGGARVVATVAGRSPRTVGLAEGLELMPSLDDVVTAADVLLDRAARRGPGRRRDRSSRANRREATVADLNATAPAARSLAAELDRAGLESPTVRLGGPPLPEGDDVHLWPARRGRRTPAPGVERVVGVAIGLASAVKMSTASVYKGRLALLTQALRAARRGAGACARRPAARSALVDRASHVAGGASVSGRYVGKMMRSQPRRRSRATPALFEAFGEVFADISRSSLAALEPEQVDPTVPVEDLLERL